MSAERAVTGSAGGLVDRFGLKKVFLVSVAGFTLASVLCGLSGSLMEIVIARVLQGMTIEGIDRPTAERRLHHTDRLRRSYLEGLYGVDADAPGTFQLVLDSTAIALDDCVEIIADVASRISS